MKISASIMAHPQRAPEAVDLQYRLGREVPIFWDSEGLPSGNADRVWRTARGGWELADPAADFHLLIQDDAVPAPDLLVGLEHALAHVPPDAVVSPYLGRGGAQSPRWERIATEADRRRASWIRSAKVGWGVCLILPTALIPEFIERADRMTGVPDDMRVAGWVTRTDREVWYTWPSLVDHRQVPSLTKHRAPDRVAQRFHQGSAYDLVWGGPVLDDPMFRIMRGSRSGPRARRQVASGQKRGTGEAGNRA